MKQMQHYTKRLSRWWHSNFTYGVRPDLPYPLTFTNNWWHAQARLIIPIVGGAGKVFLSAFNRTNIHNRHTFLEHVHKRDPGTPLLTICNHESMLDDPFLMGRLCDVRTLLTPHVMRWGVGAQEILFRNIFTSWVMVHGKIISVVRGNGVYQSGMSFAVEQLNRGQWVHIFPEGKVTLDPVRLKWGVGRLISECVSEPIVLPYWHCGMNKVYPTEKPMCLPKSFPRVPRFGKQVTVLFGEPVRYREVLDKCRRDGVCEMMTRKKLTDMVEESLYKLKVEAEKLHSQHLMS